MSTTAETGYRQPMRGMNPLYPCSDGMPMAENSVQYRWIVTIQGNLERIYRDQPNVFVAADNLIYPVEGKPEICQAPDVYVAFGVPKVDRGSFLVFEEDGIFPQVVFEIRSPTNRAADMARKLIFYDQYGAEEYYDFDPKRNQLRVYVRDSGRLEEIETVDGFISPRLSIRFDLSGTEMVIYGPNNERFLTRAELEELTAAEQNRAEAERQRAEKERRRADKEKRRADKAEQRADKAEQQITTAQQQAAAEKERADRLAAKLRAAGFDPETP